MLEEVSGQLNKYNMQVLCPQCDMTMDLPVLRDGERAQCPRCGTVLYEHRKNGGIHAASYAITALILLLIAHSAYFVGFSALSLYSSISLNDVPGLLAAAGQYALMMVFLCFSLILPLFTLISTVLLCLRVPMSPEIKIYLLRWFKRLRQWCMPEIFLAGVLVSFVKVGSEGKISVGISFAAYCLFVIFFIKSYVMTNTNKYWREFPRPDPGRRLISGRTGISQGVKLCNSCNAILPITQKKCPRCGDSNNVRIQNSVQITVALLLSSLILYFPANIFPVMQTIYLGGNMDSTIVGGAIYMWQSGSYFVGAVIFIASVTIPSLKIIALGLLCFTAERPKKPGLVICHIAEKVYRVVEFVGRWSMIDVFVVITVSSLVQIAALMNIYPKPGVLFFASVVIITMLAAKSYDPRLIWDRYDGRPR